MNQPENAVKIFEEGILMSPYNMALRTNVGSLYRTLLRPDKAREVMEKGLELCEWGDDYIAYTELTSKIVRKNAVEIMETGDTLNKSEEKSEINPGIKSGNKLEKSGKIKVIKSEIKSGQSPPAALLNNLGLVELEQGNFELALFLFEKALSVTGGSVSGASGSGSNSGSGSGSGSSSGSGSGGVSGASGSNSGSGSSSGGSSGSGQGEMRSPDGDSVFDILQMNIKRAKDGLGLLTLQTQTQT